MMDLQQLSVNGKVFGIEIVRTGNRNAYARVVNGRIVISVPRYLNGSSFEQIAKGLYSRMRRSIEKDPDYYTKTTENFDLSNRSTLKILGRTFNIRIFDCDARSGSAIIVNDEVRVFIPMRVGAESRSEPITYLIRKTLTGAVKNDVEKMVNCINSGHFNSEIGSIRITGANSRWGSCSKRRGSNAYNIALNFKLLLMDRSLLEYVIVHELAHTRQLNHSGEFWNIVEKVLPDYRARRKMLKETHS
jgi:predicted metal-dependent hydrolase